MARFNGFGTVELEVDMFHKACPSWDMHLELMCGNKQAKGGALASLAEINYEMVLVGIKDIK